MAEPCPKHFGPATKVETTAFSEKLMHSVKETVFLTSLCERTVRKLIRSKRLAIKRVGRRVLIPHSELVRFCRMDHPPVRKTVEVE